VLTDLKNVSANKQSLFIESFSEIAYFFTGRQFSLHILPILFFYLIPLFSFGGGCRHRTLLEESGGLRPPQAPVFLPLKSLGNSAPDLERDKGGQSRLSPTMNNEQCIMSND
jgi:hypothetical protein